MIDWTKQHCGVILATYDEMVELMPDVVPIIETFPENPKDFIWDVKVHMLMPNQFPCIPNWHYDMVPRVNGKQDFSLVKTEFPLYLWISGNPLPEFEDGREVKPQTWIRFTQLDLHRGTMSKEHTWRGFIRACHKEIAPKRKEGVNAFRRHCQVYLDANNFTW